jgi:nucleotide-binding universal stress UspA family protein
VDDAKIIIGYEVEQGGGDALLLATQLGSLIGGGLEVVAVLPWPQHLANADDLQREVDTELDERFAAIREQLGDFDVATRGVAHHSPAQVLLAAAEDADADLIVIGSSHRGPVGRTLLGGVGESLSHGAACAIAIAPHGYGEAEEGEFRRIAVAYDGSDEAAIGRASSTTPSPGSARPSP